MITSLNVNAVLEQLNEADFKKTSDVELHVWCGATDDDLTEASYECERLESEIVGFNFDCHQVEGSIVVTARVNASNKRICYSCNHSLCASVEDAKKMLHESLAESDESIGFVGDLHRSVALKLSLDSDFSDYKTEVSVEEVGAGRVGCDNHNHVSLKATKVIA